MHHPHNLLRRSIIFCSGLVILAACDDTHAPLTPQPETGAERLATAPAGLVAFYPFDQGPGNGTVSGAAHRPTGGLQGGAYYFDGMGAHITLPVNLNPASMPQATIGAWARIESVTSFRRAQVLSHDDGDFDRTLGLEPRPDSKHHFSAFVGLRGEGLMAGPVVTLDRWVFMAAVYNQGTVTMYVDGARYDAIGTPGTGLPTLRVGGNPAGSITGEPFHGSIDNVFVYNRALSEAEITGIRTRGACGIAATCIGIPGARDIREGLGLIGQLAAQAGQGGELRASQARHVAKLIALATGYLDQTERPATAKRQLILLRYILVELDEALGLLRLPGNNIAAANAETARVRALVQAQLDALS